MAKVVTVTIPACGGCCGEPLPTPTPTPTFTPTPDFTPTPTGTPTPEVTPTPITPTPEITPTPATPTPEETPTPQTPTPEETPTVTVTTTPSPTPTEPEIDPTKWYCVTEELYGPETGPFCDGEPFSVFTGCAQPYWTEWGVCEGDGTPEEPSISAKVFYIAGPFDSQAECNAECNS